MITAFGLLELVEGHRWVAKNPPSESSRTAQFGRCRLALEGGRIRTVSEAGESTIKLGAIERLESTPAPLLACIGPVQALVVPKNRIVRGDVDALFDELTRAVESAA